MVANCAVMRLGINAGCCNSESQLKHFVPELGNSGQCKQGFIICAVLDNLTLSILSALFIRRQLLNRPTYRRKRSVLNGVSNLLTTCQKVVTDALLCCLILQYGQIAVVRLCHEKVSVSVPLRLIEECARTLEKYMACTKTEHAISLVA